MTGTSSVSVPPGALDSSHMSTRSSSGLRVQSWHGEGAWRWASQGGSGRGAPGRAWSRSVVLLVSLIFLFVSAHAQTLDQYAQNRTALNRQIHYQAFSFFNRTTKILTGHIYDASLPADINDNSVELEAIQMVRLRSGSLKRYGIQFNEIHLLPEQVMLVQPLLYVVLVYRRFKHYSYYNTTNGTEFVSPVVGIMAYNYNDVNNYTNYGQELTVVSIGSPIQVNYTGYKRDIAEDRLSCILYNNTAAGTATGVVENVTSSTNSWGLCQWSTLGDYALLGPPTHTSSNTWKIVVGAVVGGLAALVLLILVAFLALWYREKSKFADMEHKSDQGEPLHHTWFGTSRAPSAAGTRTKPVLENENV